MSIKLGKIGVLAVSVVAYSLTAACASAPKADRDPAQEERICINARAVRNFDALGEKYVYVRESRDRHYLITMRFRCNDLDRAYTIGFSDVIGRVCANGFAKIIYSDQLHDPEDFESCAIRKIERVDDKDHAIRIVGNLAGPPVGDPGTWSEVPESDETGPDKPETDAPDSDVPDSPESEVPETQ